MADQGTQGFFSPYLRRERLRAARPVIAPPVLDFGCGTGALASLFDPQDYLGVEINDAVRATAQRRNPQHRFVSAMPKDGSYESVVGLAVIEHIADPASLLRQFKTVLAPEGKIILTTPHPSFEWVHELGAKVGLFSHDAAEEHETMLDRGNATSFAREADLELLQYKRFLFGANQLMILTHGRSTPRPAAEN
jgi:2-polyprenyl-3-methyl-5-hydroxy-6-metoxy-1,4-benzoquinol methylase